MTQINRYAAVFAILLAFMFSTNESKAQDSGIEFFHGSMAEALVKAKKENKLVFVDAYTTWCGPCRWMAANVFTDAKVGEYFNSHFINVKMDCERGEGPNFQRKYRVSAYPTLLFINEAGEVVHRTLGAKPADQFVGEGKKAVGKG